MVPLGFCDEDEDTFEFMILGGYKNGQVPSNVVSVFKSPLSAFDSSTMTDLPTTLPTRDFFDPNHYFPLPDGNIGIVGDYAFHTIDVRTRTVESSDDLQGLIKVKGNEH